MPYNFAVCDLAGGALFFRASPKSLRSPFPSQCLCGQRKRVARKKISTPEKILPILLPLFRRPLTTTQHIPIDNRTLQFVLKVRLLSLSSSFSTQQLLSATKPSFCCIELSANHRQTIIQNEYVPSPQAAGTRTIPRPPVRSPALGLNPPMNIVPLRLSLSSFFPRLSKEESRKWPSYRTTSPRFTMKYICQFPAGGEA